LTLKKTTELSQVAIADERKINSDVLNVVFSILSEYRNTKSACDTNAIQNAIFLQIYREIFLLYSKKNPDTNLITEIIKILQKNLHLSGDCPKAFREGDFGKTLQKLCNYLDQVKPPFAETKVGSLKSTFEIITKATGVSKFKAKVKEFKPIYSISASQKTSDNLCYNIQRLLDYYSNNGTSDIIREENNSQEKNRKRKWSKQLAELSKDITAIYLSEEAIEEDKKNSILAKIRALRTTITSGLIVKSRLANSLAMIENLFIDQPLYDEKDFEDGKNPLPVNFKLISKEEAKKNIYRHVIRKASEPFLEYRLKLKGRIITTTARAKLLYADQILANLNTLYLDSLEQNLNFEAIKVKLTNTLVFQMNDPSRTVNSLLNEGELGEAVNNTRVYFGLMGIAFNELDLATTDLATRILNVLLTYQTTKEFYQLDELQIKLFDRLYRNLISFKLDETKNNNPAIILKTLSSDLHTTGCRASLLDKPKFSAALKTICLKIDRNAHREGSVPSFDVITNRGWLVPIISSEPDAPPLTIEQSNFNLAIRICASIQRVYDYYSNSYMSTVVENNSEANNKHRWLKEISLLTLKITNFYLSGDSLDKMLDNIDKLARRIETSAYSNSRAAATLRALHTKFSLEQTFATNDLQIKPQNIKKNTASLIITEELPIPEARAYICQHIVHMASKPILEYHSKTQQRFFVTTEQRKLQHTAETVEELDTLYKSAKEIKSGAELANKLKAIQQKFFTPGVHSPFLFSKRQPSEQNRAINKTNTYLSNIGLKCS